MIADFIGAFLGAVIVYCLYMAHFSLLPPLPTVPKWNDNFVKPLNIPSHTRNAFISYEANGAGNGTAANLRRRRREVCLLMHTRKSCEICIHACS
jgi:glycerol uptake facilitator-like aquaporin